jgi:hypothetical protein
MSLTFMYLNVILFVMIFVYFTYLNSFENSLKMRYAKDSDQNNYQIFDKKFDKKSLITDYAKNDENYIKIYAKHDNESFVKINYEITNHENFFGILKSECNCKNNPNIYIFKQKEQDNYLIKLTHMNQTLRKYVITNDEFNNLNKTCNSYSILKRGLSQKVIGFSLYGKKRLYYDKLASITSEVKHFYPGWLIRIYFDSTIDRSIICEIECNENNNADFCYVEKVKMRLNEIKLSYNFSYVHGAIVNLNQYY